MGNGLRLDKDDRKTITEEIAQCQSRVIQTLVPTILALGLITIGDSCDVLSIRFACTFAILFSSSLYVASLSYKIFRNSNFLQVFDPPIETAGIITWEIAMSELRKQGKTPWVIHSETVTAAVIYTVLASTFFYAFYDTVNLLAVSITTVFLLIVALRIFLILRLAKAYRLMWEDLRDRIKANLTE